MKKKQLSVILIFLFLSALSSAQAELSLKIKTALSNGKDLLGFGFVVYESDDHFYLVTARHVVESPSKNLEVDKVYIYYGRHKREAQICEKHKTIDLALLKIVKRGSGMHGFRNRIASARIGDPVYIIGRYGGFNKSEDGKVTAVSNQEIKAELKGVAVGSSGGPLWRSAFFPTNHKIIGMVYSDDGCIVKAIPINKIKQFVIESLNLTTKNISDLPIVKFGIQMHNRSTFSNEITPIENYYDSKNQNISLGFFVDLAFSKHFSLVAEKNALSFKAKTSAKYLTPTTYKNSIDSYSLGIRYHPMTNLHDIDVFFTLGYSFGHMKPQVNINNSQWIELKELGHQ